ncbi:MAG: hypothetical protein JNK56_28540, partial [Myxococcales bacterium]|nr:hypothetical protein [Myxococcales bacterium]
RILDVAQAQNENGFDKKVFLGSNVELLPDTAAPIFNNYQKLADNIEFGVDHTLNARVHDNKSPLMLHDFQSTLDGPDGRPYVESWGMDPGDPDITPGDISAPGEWYGEYLWRITFNVPKDVVAFYYRLCAIDAAGNKYCTGLEHVDPIPDTTGSDSNLSTDTGTATSASGTGASDSATGDDTLPTTTDQPTAGLSTSDMTTNSAGSSESMASEGTALLNDGGCICQARPKSPGGGLWLPILALAFRRPRRMPSPNAARSVIPSPSARACPSPTSAPPCRS